MVLQQRGFKSWLVGLSVPLHKCSEGALFIPLAKRHLMEETRRDQLLSLCPRVQRNGHVSTVLPILQHGIDTMEKRRAFNGFGLDADTLLLAMREGTVRIDALALGEGLHEPF